MITFKGEAKPRILFFVKTLCTIIYWSKYCALVGIEILRIWDEDLLLVLYSAEVLYLDLERIEYDRNVSQLLSDALEIPVPEYPAFVGIAFRTVVCCWRTLRKIPECNYLPRGQDDIFQFVLHTVDNTTILRSAMLSRRTNTSFYGTVVWSMSHVVRFLPPTI